MTNHFFKNYGSFSVKKLLQLSDIDTQNNFSDIKITDVKDLVTSEKDNITFFHSSKYEALAAKSSFSFCSKGFIFT